jgi:hypothetical protein
MGVGVLVGKADVMLGAALILEEIMAAWCTEIRRLGIGFLLVDHKSFIFLPRGDREDRRGGGWGVNGNSVLVNDEVSNL